jgi:hypothetical protein
VGYGRYLPHFDQFVNHQPSSSTAAGVISIDRKKEYKPEVIKTKYLSRIRSFCSFFTPPEAN